MSTVFASVTAKETRKVSLSLNKEIDISSIQYKCKAMNKMEEIKSSRTHYMSSEEVSILKAIIRHMSKKIFDSTNINDPFLFEIIYTGPNMAHLFVWICPCDKNSRFFHSYIRVRETPTLNKLDNEMNILFKEVFNEKQTKEALASTFENAQTINYMEDSVMTSAFKKKRIRRKPNNSSYLQNELKENINENIRMQTLYANHIHDNICFECFEQNKDCDEVELPMLLQDSLEYCNKEKAYLLPVSLNEVTASNKGNNCVLCRTSSKSNCDKKVKEINLQISCGEEKIELIPYQLYGSKNWSPGNETKFHIVSLETKPALYASTAKTHLFPTSSVMSRYGDICFPQITKPAFKGYDTNDTTKYSFLIEKCYDYPYKIISFDEMLSYTIQYTGKSPEQAIDFVKEFIHHRADRLSDIQLQKTKMVSELKSVRENISSLNELKICNFTDLTINSKYFASEIGKWKMFNNKEPSTDLFRFFDVKEYLSPSRILKLRTEAELWTKNGDRCVSKYNVIPHTLRYFFEYYGSSFEPGKNSFVRGTISAQAALLRHSFGESHKSTVNFMRKIRKLAALNLTLGSCTTKTKPHHLKSDTIMTDLQVLGLLPSPNLESKVSSNRSIGICQKVYEKSKLSNSWTLNAVCSNEVKMDTKTMYVQQSIDKPSYIPEYYRVSQIQQFIETEYRARRADLPKYSQKCFITN